LSIPLEDIEVGKCYLYQAEHGIRVLRIIALLSDGRVQYDFQTRTGIRPPKKWTAGILDRAAFARMAEREVPCDWSPAMDEATR
jgi:hypothetical protein